MAFLIALVLAYLAGSIPFSLLIAKWVKGIDLRQVGSGNVGATNVGRVLGFKWFLVALALDALKGLAPTAILPPWLALAEPDCVTHLRVVAGIGALLGHLFPLWLGFKGGKGVATALGVVLILAPWGTLAALGAFLVLFGITRTVSIGSLGAAATFLIFQLVWEGGSLWTPQRWSLGLFCVAVPVLIVVMHRGNIKRLWQGTEPRSTG